MKKIGIYLSCEPYAGGAFQYSQTLLAALSRFPREDFEIIAFYRYEGWEKEGKLRNVKMERIFLRTIQSKAFAALLLYMPFLKINRFLFTRLHPLSKALRKHKIDLCIYPGADALSYLIDTPSICSILDLMHRYEKRFPEAASKAIFRRRERLYKRLVAGAKNILVDSELGAEQVRECYGAQMRAETQLYTLPYIPPSYIYEEDGLSETEGRKFAQKLPDRYIFYPAQFWKHKNHKNLLEALKYLRDERNTLVSVVFVGSSKNGFQEMADIISRDTLTAQVCILGYVSNQEIKYLYQNAVGLVMPTYFGPTNIPPLEAFYLGCPVAISNIYAMPEQAGDGALLFNPDSVLEIANCIERLWKSEETREELIAKGKERAKLWGEKQFGERLLAIVNSVLKNNY